MRKAAVELTEESTREEKFVWTTHFASGISTSRALHSLKAPAMPIRSGPASKTSATSPFVSKIKGIERE